MSTVTTISYGFVVGGMMRLAWAAGKLDHDKAIGSTTAAFCDQLLFCTAQQIATAAHVLGRLVPYFDCAVVLSKRFSRDVVLDPYLNRPDQLKRFTDVCEGGSRPVCCSCLLFTVTHRRSVFRVSGWLQSHPHNASGDFRSFQDVSGGFTVGS